MSGISAMDLSKNVFDAREKNQIHIQTLFPTATSETRGNCDKLLLCKPKRWG